MIEGSKMLERVLRRAPAKINLYLDVVGRRKDGYHDIESVFQTLELHDLVTVERAEEFTLSCSNRDLENDTNLAIIAARWFASKFDLSQSFKVHVDKRIPVAAGLGGGSSDAAAVLIALRELTAYPVEIRELAALSKELGADVPYFVLRSSLAAVTGIGESVVPLSPMPGAGVVLVKAGSKASTRLMYEGLDRGLYEGNVLPIGKFKDLLTALSAGSWGAVAPALANIFLSLVEGDDIAARTLEVLRGSPGVIGTGLSGAGPTLFALCELGAEDEVVGRVRAELDEKFRSSGSKEWEIITTRTLSVPSS